MSKELVARALELLDKEPVFIRAESFRNDPMGVTILVTRLDDSPAALIRAVDEQYPEGYDEAEGCTEFPPGVGRLRCAECRGRGTAGHDPYCRSWNTRVALLALCRDITGEKG